MRTLIVAVIVLVIGGMLGFATGAVVGGSIGIGTTTTISEAYAENQYWAGYKAATGDITNNSDARIVREASNVYLFVPSSSTEGEYRNVYLANSTTWENPPNNLNNTSEKAVNETIGQLLNQTVNATSNESTTQRNTYAVAFSH